MATIEWCKKQKEGIELVEPNENLYEEYIQTAEDTLAFAQSATAPSNVWLATTKYYCEYFAAYALLMKIGIKCEIHDCTIALCNILEKHGLFPKNFSKILENDKQLRIDNQYYLKNREVQINFDSLHNFILKIKDCALHLTQDKIEEIRKIISDFK